MAADLETCCPLTSWLLPRDFIGRFVETFMTNNDDLELRCPLDDNCGLLMVILSEICQGKKCKVYVLVAFADFAAGSHSGDT